MTEQITARELSRKVLEDLKGTGWGKELRTWWIDNEFENILQFLLEEREQDRRWLPSMSRMFQWMKAVHYSKIRTIIIVDDVGYSTEHAGIPLHTPVWKNETGEIVTPKPSRYANLLLRTIGIETNQQSGDRTDWLKQGVLIIPGGSLTRMIDGIKHHNLWNSFYPRLWEVINKKGNIPIVIVDEKMVQLHRPFLKSKNIIEVLPPILNNNTWYQDVNNILIAMDKNPIKWK